MAGISIFETHCHLNSTRFDVDRAEAMQRARTAGVSEFLEIGYDLTSSEAAAGVADPEQGIFAAVGIHPHAALEWSSDVGQRLRQLLVQPGVVAIGEIGLDFYRDLSPRDAQFSAFQAQMELALEVDRPIVVHTRESMTASLDLIEPFAVRGLRGVMHCWSGTLDEARRARMLGFLLGIGGVVTYKNPGDLADVVIDCPADALVLETDCPYLPPVPHRGQRNEPAYLPLIVDKVAAFRGETVETVASNARSAAAHLFRLEARLM